MAFLPAGPKPHPTEQKTYTLSDGTTTKNPLKKNQLSIDEKARQLMDKYKIKFNPFLAKECGYSQSEIDEYFGPTKPYAVPSPAVKTMPQVTIDSEDIEDISG